MPLKRIQISLKKVLFLKMKKLQATWKIRLLTWMEVMRNLQQKLLTRRASARRNGNRKQLESLFGWIRPLSTATKENELSPNQPRNSLGEQLDESELVTTIQTWYEKLLSVTCRNEDRI